MVLPSFQSWMCTGRFWKTVGRRVSLIRGTPLSMAKKSFPREKIRQPELPAMKVVFQGLPVHLPYFPSKRLGCFHTLRGGHPSQVARAERGARAGAVLLPLVPKTSWRMPRKNLSFPCGALTGKKKMRGARLKSAWALG